MMIARPLVAGTVAGSPRGRSARSGLRLGVVFELFQFDILPVGAVALSGVRPRHGRRPSPRRMRSAAASAWGLGGGARAAGRIVRRLVACTGCARPTRAPCAAPRAAARVGRHPGAGAPARGGPARGTWRARPSSPPRGSRSAGSCVRVGAGRLPPRVLTLTAAVAGRGGTRGGRGGAAADRGAGHRSPLVRRRVGRRRGGAVDRVTPPRRRRSGPRSCASSRCRRRGTTSGCWASGSAWRRSRCCAGCAPGRRRHGVPGGGGAGARFFNAHPYLCGLAVGAAARAEHDGAPPEQIERLRDRAVRAAGRPGRPAGLGGVAAARCRRAAVAAIALGAGWGAVAGFLLIYNLGHVALRWWALRAGWGAGCRGRGRAAQSRCCSARRSSSCRRWRWSPVSCLPLAARWLVRPFPLVGARGLRASPRCSACCCCAGSRAASSRLWLGLAAVALGLAGGWLWR